MAPRLEAAVMVVNSAVIAGSTLLVRDQLVEPREASCAVGPEIALFPPAAQCGEQSADPGAGRYPQRRHVAPGDWELRRLPSRCAIQHLGQDFPVEPPLGGKQQRQIAVALAAE